MNPRILLVDDHPIFCAGLRAVLQQQQPGAIIRQAGTGAAALQQTDEWNPDLVIMDLHLPDQNGIEVSRQILVRSPSTRILMISAEADLSYVIEAVQAGVTGYLLKTNALDELPQAVESVLSGRLHLGPEANAAVLEQYRRSTVSPGRARPALSARELEVLRHVAEGLRNKEIAIRLAVSVKTVETYRRRLMKKLGCTSPADLVRQALREGLIHL